MATCSTISALPFGPPNFTGLEPGDRPDFHGLSSIRATAQAKIEPKSLQTACIQNRQAPAIE